jgi:anti-sigma factor ChrR (cupin superfamily)
MLQASSHPEPEILAGYALGKLNESESASIEEHLTECTDCDPCLV